MIASGANWNIPVVCLYCCRAALGDLLKLPDGDCNYHTYLPTFSVYVICIHLLFSLQPWWVPTGSSPEPWFQWFQEPKPSYLWERYLGGPGFGFKDPFPAAIQRAIVSWTGASHQMPMKFWLSGVNINKCGMRTNATGKSETKKNKKIKWRNPQKQMATININ